MGKIKIICETNDTKYEFIGNQTDKILFRSHGEDNTVKLGELRYIHNRTYYCSESMKAMEGTFYYWTPVDKTITNSLVFCDLIEDLEKGIMT